MEMTKVIIKAIKDYPENASMDRSVIEKALKDAGLVVTFEELRVRLILLKRKGIISFKSVMFEDGVEVPVSGFRLR
ncbi:MAG: hypothetical protein IAE98_08920 [Candidatus Kapabacteria bacterium]|nr:hypothetical protein [Candidatus Kapabacteria bacterium]